MPISYFIDHERRRLYTRATGMVTFDDLQCHMRAEAGIPAPNYRELFDCTDATTNITANQIRKLAEQRKKIAERQAAGPVAIVAATDLFFGLFRIFDMLTEEIRPIGVFRTLSEAESWLDKCDQATICARMPYER